MADQITPIDDDDNSIQNIEPTQPQNQSIEEHHISINANTTINQANCSQNIASKSGDSSSDVDHLVVMVHGMKGRYFVDHILYITHTFKFSSYYLLLNPDACINCLFT
jgi:predicted Zn-ribbon and HTH transcriptional regulator